MKQIIGMSFGADQLNNLLQILLMQKLLRAKSQLCNPSISINPENQKLIHQVEIDGVLAIQKRRARNSKVRVGLIHQLYSENKNKQKQFIDRIRKRHDAKLYRAESDSTAKLRARSFMQKIRQMKLVQLPKLSYFSQMIRKSCSKQKKTQVGSQKQSGRISALSKYSRTTQKQKTFDFNFFQVDLPMINTQENNLSSTDRQYVRLKSLLDNYGERCRLKTIS